MFGRYHAGRAQFSGNELIAPATSQRYAWSEYVEPQRRSGDGVYPKPGC